MPDPVTSIKLNETTNMIITIEIYNSHEFTNYNNLLNELIHSKPKSKKFLYI
jgi:hypothetical protein